MRPKQIFSLVFITIGCLLLLSGVGYALFSGALNSPSAAPLPEQLAALPLVYETSGRQAVEEIARLHRQDFPLTSAAIGVYGLEPQATLWVSGSPLEFVAARMLSSMQKAIARGDSPFTPTGERRDGRRTIYELDGMGQKHFYFRSGNLLIWLTADPPLAETALRQVLAFYP